MDFEDPLFLGVDGGGTACRARLVDAAGRRLGDGQAGPANIRLGLKESWAQILVATDRALAAAGLDRDSYARIHAGFGLAGITIPADADRFLAVAPDFAAVTAASDGYVACLGAFGGRDGAILILGTGSAGQALIGGRSHQIGGWGFEVSDEASSAELGRAAIRAALKAHDGLGPGGRLADAVMAKLGRHPSLIVAWANEARPEDYGSLAPLVFDTARHGDTVAIGILRQAAEHVDAFVRRLIELGAAKVALMGGLAPALRSWLSPWAQGQLAEPQGDAMDGAVLMARNASRGT